MNASDILLQDLADAAGHVLAQAMDALPPHYRQTLALGREGGAALEVRIREGVPALITVWATTGTDSVLVMTADTAGG